MPDLTIAPAESTDQPEIVNLANTNVGAVTAEMVRMHQSSAEAITSEDVELNISAAGMVNATTLCAAKPAGRGQRRTGGNRQQRGRWGARRKRQRAGHRR